MINNFLIYTPKFLKDMVHSYRVHLPMTIVNLSVRILARSIRPTPERLKAGIFDGLGAVAFLFVSSVTT